MVPKTKRDFWIDFGLCFALILVYLLLGWFYWRLVAVPAKPDEIGHLTYVAEIRLGHVWPVMRSDPNFPCGAVRGTPDERFQPPLYYWLSALVTLPTPVRWPGEWTAPNPWFSYSWASAPGGNLAFCVQFPEGNPFLMALRLWSWLLGVLIPCGVYLGARAWLPRPAAVLASMLATTMPSVLFSQTGVSNIALFVPLNALSIAQTIWIWRSGWSPARARRLSILLVLAFYTRLEAVFLLLPVAFALLRTHWSITRGLWAGLRWGIRVAVWILPLFARNLFFYGDPLARVGLFPRGWTVPLGMWIRYEGWNTYRLIFTSLGHGAVYAPDGFYMLTGLFLLPGLMGTIHLLCCTKRFSEIWMLLFHAVAVVIAAVLLSLRYIVGGPRYIATAGLSWYMLWAAGYMTFWPQRVRYLALAGAIVFWYVLSLAVLFQILFPIYVPRAAERSGAPVAFLGKGIVLHRATITPSRARPGDDLIIRLVWEATEPVAGNYAVFVHALEPDAPRILAQEDTFPFYGHYPTMLWVPGKPFEDIHHLRLPSDLNVPYVRLTTGLYDYKTMERLPAIAPDGTPFEAGGPYAIPIGQVVIAGSEAPPSGTRQHPHPAQK